MELPVSTQHGRGREPEEESSWVCFALAGDVGCGSMDGFKDGCIVPDVA